MNDERREDTMDKTGGPLASRRYRQLCESNVPDPFAAKLVKRVYEPVECEAGLQIGPPDFIGIGTMKSGTSWWYALLSQHPRIYSHAGWRKELHFFDLMVACSYGPEEIQEYHRMFCRPTGLLSGEWTPRYFSDFWAPALIKKAAPDAKLLLLLRDPVNRFVSGVTHQVIRGIAPRTSIVDMWQSQFTRGLYHQHLSRYLQLFDRNRILVLQYERCVQDPAAELARTFEFLGLDMPDRFTAAVLRRGRNVTRRDVKISVPPHLLASLVQQYKEDVERLVQECPEIDPDLWEHFAALV